MATQDDNTILSKADLKAYHQKILPFLGGNAFLSTSHSDYYSTKEKMVGVWTDGKPIYQKTYDFGTNTPIPAATQSGSTPGTLVMSGFTSIDRLITIKAMSNGGNYYYISAYPENAIGKITLTNYYNTVINIRYVTVQYTKTTDTTTTALTTPGAYDLNRPDLWPANKEIFFGDGLYGYRATGTHNIQDDTRVDTNIVDIGVSSKFVSFGGSVSWSSNGSGTDIYQNPLPFDSPLQDGSKPVSVQLLRAGSGKVILRTWGNLTYSDLPFDIWFTYKK